MLHSLFYANAVWCLAIVLFVWDWRRDTSNRGDGWTLSFLWKLRLEKIISTYLQVSLIVKGKTLFKWVSRLTSVAQHSLDCLSKLKGLVHPSWQVLVKLIWKPLARSNFLTSLENALNNTALLGFANPLIFCKMLVQPYSWLVFQG